MALGTFIISLVAAVASLQAVSAGSIAPRDGPPVLRWKGPVFDDGRPWETLYVTDVNDLWDKVLTINPGWTIKAADPDATLKDYGMRHSCPESHVATGNSDEISRILSRLRQLGGDWTIEKNRCHRLGCGQDAGVYWCNNNDWNIRTSADALHIKGSHIRDGCCHRSDGSLYSGDPISGVEVFPDDHNEADFSRVIVGWGSCEDRGSIVPLAYSFPGKLGECRT